MAEKKPDPKRVELYTTVQCENWKQAIEVSHSPEWAQSTGAYCRLTAQKNRRYHIQEHNGQDIPQERGSTFTEVRGKRRKRSIALTRFLKHSLPLLRKTNTVLNARETQSGVLIKSREPNRRKHSICHMHRNAFTQEPSHWVERPHRHVCIYCAKEFSLHEKLL